MKHRRTGMRSPKAPVIACLIALAIMFLVGKAWGINWPIHAQLGWTLDSMKWVKTVDSLRTDSSGKIYDVTGWPETTFTITLGSRHEIIFYYWAPSLDSGVWPWTWDLYDYNNANCVGGAPYVASFYVLDTNVEPDAGIAGVQVCIKQDSATGGTEKWWWTDQDGYIEFGLNNGDWSAVSAKAGLASAASLDFTIASGPYHDTIEGYMIQLPAPPGGPLDMASVNVFYFRDGTAIKGARLFARNQNVATDTTNNVLIGPVQVTDYSNNQGLATVSVPKSYIYHDSLKALYDISLYHGSKLVKLWQDYWVPDQDTVRLVVEE